MNSMSPLRKSLPMFVQPETCGSCGGACCKQLPGIASPDDFGAPDRDEMRMRLKTAFDSGRWAIDWWEGDPRDGRDELDSARYVRPATKWREGRVRDASWGGACTFFGAVGCELAADERPLGCRSLEPAANHKDCIPHDGDKRDMAIAWLPYLDLLLEIEDRSDS